MTTIVGIYARISVSDDDEDDDPDGTGSAVGRQIKDARGLCARRGWTPAPEPYVDKDLSAYKRTVVRPAFERLLKDLESGAIQGIVVYDFDRFTRQPRDLERAIDIYERTSDLVFASIQGDLDLVGDGKLMARIYAAAANKSSADTARRVKRKHLELARQGIPVGGTRPRAPRPDWRGSVPPADGLGVRRLPPGLARRRHPIRQIPVPDGAGRERRGLAADRKAGYLPAFPFWQRWRSFRGTLMAALTGDA